MVKTNRTKIENFLCAFLLILCAHADALPVKYFYQVWSGQAMQDPIILLILYMYKILSQ